MTLQKICDILQIVDMLQKLVRKVVYKMQHQVSESKEFYADNVHFVWNTSVSLNNSLILPVEVQKHLFALFEVCNKYLLEVGKWEVDTFANVDEE